MMAWTEKFFMALLGCYVLRPAGCHPWTVPAVCERESGEENKCYCCVMSAEHLSFIVGSQFYWREYNDALIVCDRWIGWLTVLFLSWTEMVHRHMQQYEVEYLQFAFRWMNNLLMRELPLRCTIRLWDTYQVKETFNSLCAINYI